MTPNSGSGNYPGIWTHHHMNINIQLLFLETIWNEIPDTWFCGHVSGIEVKRHYYVKTNELILYYNYLFNIRAPENSNITLRGWH